MSTTIDTHPAPIDTDLPCSSCGYNLRGLQSDGKCPECAGSFAASIEVHRRGIPRQLLTRTRLSVRLMLAGFAAVFVGGLPPDWYNQHGKTWWGVLLVWMILTGWGWAASAIHFLVIAEPAPRRILPGWRGILALLASMVSLCTPLLVLLNDIGSKDPAVRRCIVWLLPASAVATWAYFDLLRHVARAINARGLAVLLRAVSFGAPVATVMMWYLVIREMARMSVLVFSAIAPAPGIGFASTVMLIAWQMILSHRFSNDMLLWYPVPVFALASVVALIWMHIALRRRLELAGGDDNAPASSDATT